MPKTQCPSAACVANKKKGRLFLQTRGSHFVKYQEIKVQELPEQVPVGHIPRTLTLIARGEMTRKLGPGDIADVAGIFLPTPFTVRPWRDLSCPSGARAHACGRRRPPPPAAPADAL